MCLHVRAHRAARWEACMSAHNRATPEADLEVLIQIKAPRAPWTYDRGESGGMLEGL
ncbi:MAG: hypothetical protein AMXMBFR33_31790 [Candidatus Xenobia bacterium]